MPSGQKEQGRLPNRAQTPREPRLSKGRRLQRLAEWRIMGLSVFWRLSRLAPLTAIFVLVLTRSSL